MKAHSCGDSRLTCIDCQAQICPACLEQCPVGNRCRKCTGRFTGHITKLPLPIMLRTGAAAAALGFAYGFFYESLMGGFYIWFLVYIGGVFAGKFLHKLANHKYGKTVIATIASGIIIGAFLSPAQDSMLGKPTDSSFMGLKVNEEELIANAPVIAKKRFPEFEQQFKASGKAETFSVKAPFEENGAIDHMWIKVSGIDGKKINGTIQGLSPKLPNLKAGSDVTVESDQIEDWLYTRNGEEVGNFGIGMVERLKRRGETEWMGAGWVWINIAILIAGAISPVLAVRIKN